MISVTNNNNCMIPNEQYSRVPWMAKGKPRRSMQRRDKVYAFQGGVPAEWKEHGPRKFLVPQNGVKEREETWRGNFFFFLMEPVHTQSEILNKRWEEKG